MYVRSVLAAVMAALLVWQPVAATDNISQKWRFWSVNGYDYWIVWRFDSGFPSNSTMRNYVSNGRFEWNDVGRELWFSWNQSASDPFVWVRYNDLWWPFNGALAVAVKQNCYHSAYICSADITFNKTIDGGWQHWYGQPGFTCDNKYVDIWSTAAHEFGHLVSLNHSPQTADTMYATIECATTNKRSLTTHDKDGIKQLYPAH